MNFVPGTDRKMILRLSLKIRKTPKFVNGFMVSFFAFGGIRQIRNKEGRDNPNKAM